ncbi:hypothetical protein BDV35DRAFT_358370 [Aspergillus flavus]|uniref:Uncharacterized protein n=1 Tax=Aspergillus flavus TaxID=5059 RepID=A0A5N6GSQ6_ASPFL|nr:hypothetical protein BDV35DRAFT_358370 [Aspergillus flavus]
MSFRRLSPLCENPDLKTTLGSPVPLSCTPTFGDFAIPVNLNSSKVQSSSGVSIKDPTCVGRVWNIFRSTGLITPVFSHTFCGRMNHSCSAL